MTKEDVIQNIELIINNTIIGEIYEIEGNNLSILIYPTNSTSLTNKTHIDFIECEYALRNYYNISNQSIISFFQIELNNPNKQSLINQVEYQVYDEYKNILDLSICNDSNIKIFHGIKTNSGLNVSLLNSFKDTDINIFNISDDFFNDVCYPYSENGNDIILEDRIKDIYQNYTLCEEDCIFENIDLTNMLIECKCNIKQNISTVIHEIKEEAVDKITSLNFEIIKCYNLAFTLSGKNKNIGFWILSIFLLAHLPLLIIYFSKGIKPVEKYIFKEMENYGYITKKQNEKINENKNIHKSVNIIRNYNIQNTNINVPPKKKKLSIKLKNEQNEPHSKKRKKSIKKNSLRSLINNVNISNNFFLHKNKIDENALSKDKNDSKTNLELNLISINLNNISKKNDYAPKESNITLYNYTMEEAFKYDRRNLCIIFYIYLLSKQAFFHAFLYRSPLEIFPLRFCLLLFIISSDLALNALFYFNDNISRKYRYTKNIFFFTFSNNMTVILLSTFVGFFFLTLFTKLSNSTKDIRDVFKEEEKKIRKNKGYKVTDKRKGEIKKKIENILQNYKCKIIILFVIELILMMFYWYYVVIFCQVFSGTQMSWLIDSILSMISRFIMDAILCFGFAKLYNIGVSSNYECIYKIALFFYGFSLSN